MGSGKTRSSSPDLFSEAFAQETRSLSAKPPSSPNAITRSSKADSFRRHVPPSDLNTAIKQLEDLELDRLALAALAEQKRRGRKPIATDESTRKLRVEVAAAPLTTGKLNAVRAAFKAGVKPSQIARQFGISQSDVRKALAFDDAKR